MAHITEELLKLSPSTLVVLYELDLTEIGDTKYFFYEGTTESNENIVWQGNAYSALPIEATGFDVSSEGVQATPTVTISNVFGTMSTLAREFNDLLGAKVVRRRTMLKYLDAVNFESGNVEADPTVGYEDDVFFVNRKSSETHLSVEFELSSPWDVENILLPKRQIIKNLCSWTYRDPLTCGYSGDAIADEFDAPTNLPSADRCSKTLHGGCKLRFPIGELPYGGFPAAGLVR